jgi:hypothetical protein
LREQISHLTVEFKLNLPQKSERLTKPLPAIPPYASNRRPMNVPANGTSSSGHSREATVGPSRETQPDLNRINRQESTSNWGALKQPSIVKEGTDVVEEATLPLNHTSAPERDLIVSMVPPRKPYRSFTTLTFDSFRLHLLAWIAL